MIRLSAHLGTLFPELAPLERPAAARAAGFAAVETWWPPADDPADWVAAVRAAGLRAVVVNADGGDLAAGDRGFCTVGARRDEVVASAAAALDVARACGGDTVNLLAGHLDPGLPAGPQRDAALAAVREAGEEAARGGGRVVIEHLNDRDVTAPLLPTPAAAAAFVREVDHPGVRLLFDAYHAHRAGLDPMREVGEVIELVGHVQYADSPGRGAPGTGAVDLGRLVDRLGELGYDGHVGLEFVPEAPGTGWIEALGPALRRGASLGPRPPDAAAPAPRG